jgi:DNA-nicking Smr family endonuclease
VKKKYSASKKDKEDWINFTKKLENLYNKDVAFDRQTEQSNKIPKIDLHGTSLNEANRYVKKFINDSFEQGYKKILIVTGKGLRSKVYEDPYRSKSLNILKNSVPEFIKNEKNLSSKISRISNADIKDGGEGAIYVYLKKQKEL